MKKPITDRGKEFDKEMNISGISDVINEYDRRTLNEKKYKLKRKIFSLPKMEAMVHADPRLSTIYNQMAEDGKDKYGYHYNETIMNIIFNDYVLNSPKYLQKYKNTKPAKKKRRDRFGIEQMKKQYDKTDKDKKTKNKKDMDETQEMTSFSRYGKGSGTIDSNIGDLNETVKSGDIKSSKKDNKPSKGEFAGEKFSGDSIAKKPIDEEKEIDESTSTSGAGDYQYAGPGIWSKSGKPAMRKPFWIGGKVIGESDYLTESKSFKEYYNILNNLNIDDYLNEHHKKDKKSRIDFIMKNIDNISDLKSVLSKLSEDEIEKIYNELERKMGLIDETELSMVDQPKPDSMSNKPEPMTRTGQTMDMGMSGGGMHESSTNEEAKSKAQQQFMSMVKGVQEKTIDTDDVGDKVKKAAKEMKPSDVDDFVNTDTKNLPDKIDENIHMTVEYDSDRSGEEPFNLGGIKWQFVNAIYPDGKRDIGVYRFDHDLVYDYEWWRENFLPQSNKRTFDIESLDEIDELLKETDKILDEIGYYKKIKENMNEEKKTPSMVSGDRLRKENEKNFKSDLQTSGTKEAIDAQKDLQHKDQQIEIKDPKKFSEDIEKEALKKSGGDALKNKGDSTSDGEHIPKRNHTDEEMDEVDLTRKGMQDWQYDNKPSERFEERMKDGMGEDLYKQRQEKMKRNANAPTYNKDSQPIVDGDDKEQFNKFKNESMISGLYFDGLNKRRLIDFQLNEVKKVDKINESWFKIHFEGMGNTYNNKVEINETVVNELMNSEFYVDNNKNVYMINIDKQLNENVGVNLISDDKLNKMKHLFGYNPKNYTDTKNTKMNRGF